MKKPKLVLNARRISPKSSEAMCSVAKSLVDPHYNPYQEIQKAEEAVKNLTKHKYAKIVNSGNAAILTVMSALGGPILVPDQGGWSGCKQMADLLGIETQTIKTEKGLIIPTLLDEYLKNNTCKIFFLTSFAGYMAEQPIEDIYQICDEHEVIMVEDASGSVGDHSGKLACGKHSHIIIASTGSPKILNVGNGGFISTDLSELFQSSRNVLKTLRPSPLTCTGILNEIKYAPDIFKKTVQACGYFKKNIQNVSHKDKRGMNVCLEVDEPDYVSKIIKKNILVFGSNFVTKCPTYERIMEPAVCLEIKNIDIKFLEKEYLNRILEIVIDIDKDM